MFLSSGFIPKGLGNLDKLNVLELSSNHFNIFNSSTLTLLNLGYNPLSGLLPSYLGIGFPNLEMLVLAGNVLTGQIPNSISNVSKLIRLHLLSNKFRGAIPDIIGNLTNLMILDLHGNDLIGLIPDIVNKLNRGRGLLISQPTIELTNMTRRNLKHDVQLPHAHKAMVEGNGGRRKGEGKEARDFNSHKRSSFSPSTFLFFILLSYMARMGSKDTSNSAPYFEPKELCSAQTKERGQEMWKNRGKMKR